MKKEYYNAPSIELIEAAPLTVLVISGENEIEVGNGGSFF